MQTKFGAPDGNCLAACIASILEIPLGSVDVPGTDEWSKKLAEWCSDNGYGFVWVNTSEIQAPEGSGSHAWSDDIYWIATGKCDREQDGEKLYHCVVARGSEFVHDPNPAGTFIESVEDAILVFPLPGVRRVLSRYKGPHPTAELEQAVKDLGEIEKDLHA